jgi:hypothetical protein
MEKRAFSFIHDLFNLNDEQRAQYAADASEYFGLPRELNALDFITMDDGTGLRKLVLYARKGTADLLRDIHGISIVSLTPCHTADFAAFVAVGTNKIGRQEIAIGACSIVGLKGDRLASAVMTAQTRADRRLTLQFVGGGLLDESEVNSTVADIRSSAASLAQLSGSPTVFPPMPPPAVKPNAAPGLDTTKATGIGPIPIGETIDKCVTLQFVGGGLSPLLPDEAVKIKSEECCDEAGNPVVKKRTRRKKGAVDISSPAQNPSLQTITESPNNDILECMREATHPLVAAAEMGAKAAAYATTGLVDLWGSKRLDAAATPPPPRDNITVPAAPPQLPVLKFEEYRTRFRKYANEILPKEGGMTNSNGMGITSKVRKFAEKMSGGVTVLNEEQWINLFKFLDDYYAEHGAVSLVAYIEKEIA